MPITIGVSFVLTAHLDIIIEEIVIGGDTLGTEDGNVLVTEASDPIVTET